MLPNNQFNMPKEKKELIDQKVYFKSDDAVKLEKLKIQKKQRQSQINSMIKTLKMKSVKKITKLQPRNPLEGLEHSKVCKKSKKSRLHKKDINTWLRTRYFNKVHTEYLYYPEEIEKRIDLIAIFKNFDADGNGELEIDEFLDMFIITFLTKEEVTNPTKIFSAKNVVSPEKKINGECLEELKIFLTEGFQKFYSYITKKHFLTLEEFIRLCLNRKAIEFFVQLMKMLMVTIDKMGKVPLRFIPLSFDKMVKLLGQESKKDEIYKEFIEIRDQNPPKAFKLLSGLMMRHSIDSKQKLLDEKKKIAAGKILKLGETLKEKGEIVKEKNFYKENFFGRSFSVSEKFDLIDQNKKNNFEDEATGTIDFEYSSMKKKKSSLKKGIFTLPIAKNAARTLKQKSRRLKMKSRVENLISKSKEKSYREIMSQLDFLKRKNINMDFLREKSKSSSVQNFKLPKSPIIKNSKSQLKICTKLSPKNLFPSREKNKFKNEGSSIAHVKSFEFRSTRCSPGGSINLLNTRKSSKNYFWASVKPRTTMFPKKYLKTLTIVKKAPKKLSQNSRITKFVDIEPSMYVSGVHFEELNKGSVRRKSKGSGGDLKNILVEKKNIRGLRSNRLDWHFKTDQNIYSENGKSK